MKIFSAAVIATLLVMSAWADVVTTNQDARVILERVLANRPAKDFSLKARLFVGRDEPVPVEILMKNRPQETRTIYRAGRTELLVVQPIHADPRFYLRGTGELTGAQRSEKLLGSHFSYYDLGLPFLRWPNAKFLGEDRVRGRDCFALESVAAGELYARVKMWIDKNYFALLKAEAFDANGDLTRRFAITSFKRLGEVWIPRGLEAAFVPPGQSLPAQEKSRLEIYEGDYEALLPAEWFSTDRFATTPGAPAPPVH
jgi:Outer membrane lipoprotein-sorting protein